MAISNVALAAAIGGAPGNPQYIDIVTLDLSAGYTTGGWVDFSASVEAAIGKGKTIRAIVQNNFPGTPKVLVTYDRAADTLLCHTEALVEVAPAGDLVAVVGLELVIFSN